MAEQEIDLSGAWSAPRYSAHTEGLAEWGIREGRIVLVGDASATCQSLSGPDIWHPAASLNDEQEIVGVTCDCLNGRKGGIRARCWHACALEKLLEGRSS